MLNNFPALIITYLTKGIAYSSFSVKRYLEFYNLINYRSVTILETNCPCSA